MVRRTKRPATNQAFFFFWCLRGERERAGEGAAAAAAAARGLVFRWLLAWGASDVTGVSGEVSRVVWTRDDGGRRGATPKRRSLARSLSVVPLFSTPLSSALTLVPRREALALELPDGDGESAQRGRADEPPRLFGLCLVWEGGICESVVSAAGDGARTLAERARIPFPAPTTTGPTMPSTQGLGTPSTHWGCAPAPVVDRCKALGEHEHRGAGARAESLFAEAFLHLSSPRAACAASATPSLRADAATHAPARSYDVGPSPKERKPKGIGCLSQSHSCLVHCIPHAPFTDVVMATGMVCACVCRSIELRESFC
jgi:hypothetical protein